MAKKSKRKKIFIRPIKTDCDFCKNDIVITYKDYQRLQKYISERAKIIPSKYTGTCSKHQRVLGREIKRARFLGLLPTSVSF